MHTAKYAFMVIMMSLVWLGVQQAQGLPGTSPQEIITYFLLAAILYSVSNFHTYYIEEDIKFGHLSKFLLKPISFFYYYMVFQLGHVFIETVLKLVLLGGLMMVFGLTISTSWQSLGVFSLFIPIVFWCAFNLFSIISLLTFWLTEAWALRWTLTIVFRFLSGMLVPISFFPVYWQRLFYFLPFEHLTYTPISLLQNQITWHEGLKALVILLVWTVGLHIVRETIWRTGLKSYEGNGI